jgi:putative transcriptional regulator
MTISLNESRAERRQGCIDAARVDATSEAEIQRQKATDDMAAREDAIAFVRGVRSKLGLSQREFSEATDIPLNSIRNWEQGKRGPTGAARTLYRLLNARPDVLQGLQVARLD